MSAAERRPMQGSAYFMHRCTYPFASLRTRLHCLKALVGSYVLLGTRGMAWMRPIYYSFLAGLDTMQTRAHGHAELPPLNLHAFMACVRGKAPGP